MQSAHAYDDFARGTVAGESGADARDSFTIGAVVIAEFHEEVAFLGGNDPEIVNEKRRDQPECEDEVVIEEPLGNKDQHGTPIEGVAGDGIRSLADDGG